MNAKILLPLIQEYVKDPALTESEVSDMVVIAREMAVGGDTVRALVAIEKFKTHGLPTHAEPFQLVYNLLASLGVGGRLHKEATDFVHGQALQLGMGHHQVDLLLKAYQLSVVRSGANPQKVIFQLMQAMQRSGPLTGTREEFIRTRAAEMEVLLEVYSVLLAIASEQDALTGARSYVLFDQLLQALGVDRSLRAQAREFALEIAREIGISEDIAYAMIDVYQQAGVENPQENIPLLDALVKGFVRRGLSSTEEREFLADQAYKLRIPVAGADALIRYELLVTSRQTALASAQLKQVIHQLGLNGQGGKGLSAFVTQLELELNQIQGAETLLKRVEDAILAKKIARGEITRTEARETQAEFTAKERQATAAPAATVAEEVVRQGQLNQLSRGLTDALVYKLNTQSYAISKAQMYCHAAGFTWYLLLKDAISNRPTSKLLVINGQEIDVANIGDLTFSHNGLLYAYKRKEDKNEVAVLNSKPGEPFDAVGALTFSQNEKHFAYLAKKGRGWHVVLDGDVGPASPALRDLHFNPHSQKPAYVNYSKGFWQVVHDGIEDKLYSAVGGITFSPDGKHLVYWAKKGNQYFAIIDGTETAAFSGVGEFTFSRDSSQLAYMVNRDRLLAVVHNGRVSENYDIIRKLSFSADGRSLGYMVKKNNREYTVVNGQPETIYDKVNGLVWSSVGNAYAYEATLGREKMVVLNGQPGPKFEQISGITFNPTNESVAYAGYRDNAWYVVQDGRLSEPYTDVNELTFSPNGKYLTFFAKLRNEWSGLVRDGERIFEAPSPKYLCYSDDGDNLGFLYYKGRSWHLVINGKEVAQRTYENILHGLHFDNQKQAFFLLAQTGPDIRQITFA